MIYRIGQGIDVHQLDEGPPLIIGGISIPYNKGSIGHSDGDVLFHSIVDALLGALSLGDIGTYFPSNDLKWKDANSQIFLEYTYKILINKKFKIENIDTTIILQKPIINPYIKEMKENIKSLLSLNMDQISIKATTTDKLGFIGSSKGICVISNILLISNEH